MNMGVRSMKKRDIRAVQKVATSSWKTTYQGIIPTQVQDDFLREAYNVRMLKRRFKQSNFFVATVDDEIVGFADYSPLDMKGKTNLYALYIYEEFQGRGIGTALLDSGIKHLHAKQIIISVEKGNEKAIHFYHAKGFEIFDTYQDDFHGHIIHTIRMRLNIDSGAPS